MLVNNYIMSPRRVGATAGARARHESMIRALNPGEFFTFEEFQMRRRIEVESDFESDFVTL